MEQFIYRQLLHFMQFLLEIAESKIVSLVRHLRRLRSLKTPMTNQILHQIKFYFRIYEATQIDAAEKKLSRRLE
jgi:hypothetical protein